MRLAPLAIALLLVGWTFGELSRFEARKLTLSGVQLPAGDPEPFVRELAAIWLETEVTLDAGSSIVRATRQEIGGRIDVERTVRDAKGARGSAPIWTRTWALAIGQGGTIRFHREVSNDATVAFVEALRRRVAIEPQAVRRNGTGGRAGLTLNLMGAAAAIREALTTDALFVSLPVRRIEPPVRPVRDERTAHYTEIVAAYETHYSGTGELSGRANNIETAARALDGLAIAPQGELSFNEIVGERTFDRGYLPATELAQGGRRVEGIGGGVCQTAATLHAAAFFAGFAILEHHPHTRESSYIDVGLDAAVAWPSKDLRIRNPYPFPVRLRVTAYHGTLRIELRGGERAPRIEWSTNVIGRVERGVEREVDSNLPLGSHEVLDEGEDGSVVERTRTIHWPEGATSETVMLRYPVVHRLIRAGPQSVGRP